MGQDRILEVLAQKPTKWFSIRELATATNTCYTPTARAARQLGKFGLVAVDIRPQTRGGHPFLLFYKKK